MEASTHSEPSVRVVAITTIGALFQIHGALKPSEVRGHKDHKFCVVLIKIPFATDFGTLGTFEGDSFV